MFHRCPVASPGATVAVCECCSRTAEEPRRPSDGDDPRLGRPPGRDARRLLALPVPPHAIRQPRPFGPRLRSRPPRVAERRRRHLRPPEDPRAHPHSGAGRRPRRVPRRRLRGAGTAVAVPSFEALRRAQDKVSAARLLADARASPARVRGRAWRRSAPRSPPRTARSSSRQRSARQASASAGQPPPAKLAPSPRLTTSPAAACSPTPCSCSDPPTARSRWSSRSSPTASCSPTTSTFASPRGRAAAPAASRARACR